MAFMIKFPCLMRLLIEDGLYLEANDFHSMISKINYYYWLIAVIFIEIIFSVNPVCYLVRNHFIHVNHFRTMSIIPSPRYNLLGNFLRDKI